MSFIGAGCAKNIVRYYIKIGSTFNHTAHSCVCLTNSNNGCN